MASAENYLGVEPDWDGLEITRSKGCLLFDHQRRRYIDFLSGWCVGNLGWSRPEIIEALRRYDGPFYVYPGYLHAPWLELAKMLIEIAPGPLKKCFRATGGSEAVDIALQAAMLHTGRSGFMSVEGCYHGNTIGARSVGDSRDEFPNRLRGCRSIKPPLDANATDRVETILKSRKIAAVIMEPVICNLGVLIPEAAFMKALQRLCKRYGTLLIMDEVATGFGRTGKMFATEHFGIEPDILCLAKAITAGHAPMGAVLMTAAVAKSMQKVGAYSTYGWHPLSVAAAIANLHYWKRNGARLLKHTNAMGVAMGARLGEMRFRKRGELRVIGLAIGLDVGSESYADKIVTRCRDKGLLIGNEGEALTLFPPLAVDGDIADEAINILKACL